MEGIMMRHKERYSVAVRKPNGEIEVKMQSHQSWQQGAKLWRLPIFRGMYSFVDSMVIGIRCLMYSASFFEEEEEESVKENAGKQEKKEELLLYGTVALSICFSVVLFIIAPYLLASLLRLVTNSEVVISLAEAAAKMLIFFAYMILISKMEEIQRVFMYHGAEHKCINCIEHGMELNVGNVMKSSREHKRCGTSFLLFVMIVSVIFFLFIRVSSPWLRVLTRILLLPVIAGVSYEIIRLAGNSEHPLVVMLSKPGLALQKLTTREPTEDMVEVAICAVEAVFDWRAYLQENISKEGKDR